jgi:hypothetical protein
MEFRVDSGTVSVPDMQPVIILYGNIVGNFIIRFLENRGHIRRGRKKIRIYQRVLARSYKQQL